MSLKEVEPTNRTSLTEAIINAVSQLRRYTCQRLDILFTYKANTCINRRILCLTDGFNNCGTSYTTALESARVSVYSGWVFNKFLHIE